MNLTKVANKAVTEASNVIGASLTKAELEKITGIIAKAMEDAALEASAQHSSVCVNCLSHEMDLAHQIRKEMELKKIALIANLLGFTLAVSREIGVRAQVTLVLENTVI